MIDKMGGFYYVICDICGEGHGDGLFEFYDAVQFKKDEGWKSQKRNNKWIDICPDCQGKK